MVTIRIKKSKFMPEDFSAYVSFPYNEDILHTIQSLDKRSWIKGTKEWEIRIKDISVLLSKFSYLAFNIYGRYVDLSPKKFDLTAYHFKTDCYKHQLEGFEYGMHHDRWLLGDDQGLGKSKQAIDIAVARKQLQGFKHCLIICGVNSLKWNWRNEIKTHSNESSHILGQKIKKNGQITIGSNKDKLNDIVNLDSISAYFLITNIETLRNDEINDEIIHQIDDGNIPMIVVDEMHKAKSTSSIQGKALMKLQPKVRIAMTGTPLMNSPLDLYAILKWLGYEKHAFYTFKNYYCIMGGYGGYEIVGYKHLEELESQLQSIMLRRLKKEVLDLPEKTYIDDYVDMLPKQSIVYKEVKAEIKSNIDMISISPNPLAEMIRLRQATGYTGILSSEIQCSAKLDRMEELVADSIANGQQVIVFSNWSQITDVAYVRLRIKYATNCITGATKDNERQIIVDDFQVGRCKVLIGTIGAMGTGLTLTAGTVVIFLDHPWSRALYEQAVDRAHRIGQTSNITIYNIMAKDTIDERIWELVKRKGELSDKIVDQDGKVMTNRDIANYLLS